METYWSILQSTRGSNLRLTKYDDAILAQFQEEFPEFDVGGVIDEDAMKSKEGKERWRAFISKYEDKIEDFNFGTMVRADAADEYGEKEAIFGTFLLIYLYATIKGLEHIFWKRRDRMRAGIVKNG